VLEKALRKREHVQRHQLCGRTVNKNEQTKTYFKTKAKHRAETEDLVHLKAGNAAAASKVIWLLPIIQTSESCVFNN
jgi:hypothetical protein